MPPEGPYDREQDDYERLNRMLNDYIEEAPPRPQVAWLDTDCEYYPVWSTTLYEQDQIWRTKFDLRTSEQRQERLAQEAWLYVACNDILLEP